jgi:cbb3-type cytochrome oxidase subunit 3
MIFKHRSIGLMILLQFFTCGIYLIYWLVATKKELNRNNAQIPSAWLLIIPFANIYFIYCFAQGFAKVILKDSNQAAAYFVLLLFLLPIAALICQSNINDKTQSLYS